MELIRGFDQLCRGDVDIAGGKGANLGELVRAGLPVPPGFVLTTAAYREFVDTSGIGETVVALAAGDPEEAAVAIRALFLGAEVPESIAVELRAAATTLGPESVAVRSSATAEDLADASFAGQQDTYLNVRGATELLVAVRDCWASLWTARAIAYRSRRGIAPAEVALAVVVQLMVEADAAGVMFTADPTTGRRDQAVVSAAWGLGESVVSGSVTTDDLVVDKAGGTVASRTTADKAVMTVYAEPSGGGHGTEERPVSSVDRARPVLDDGAAAELVALGVATEEHFGAPQDIEWARAAGTFWIVQARPITALPEPETAPPTDWSVPVARAVYIRASIVEQLPDPLSTLFGELVDGAVTRSLGGLFGQFFGGLREGDIGLPMVNGYAYYRYTNALFLRMLRGTPTAVRALARGGNTLGRQGWEETAHPRYAAIVAEQSARSLRTCTDADLLDGASALLEAGAEYYTAVQSIVPIAASSEIALTQYYNLLVRRKDDPPAATLLLGFDSAPIRAERSLYGLASWTRQHPVLAAALLAGDDPGAGPDADEWRTRFRTHLDAHGHTVYNLDFANAVPADDPGPLLETLRFYLRGGGTDPDDRQQASARRREALTAEIETRLDPLRRAAFLRLLRWAQGIAPVREDALADIGLGWPQLRRMLRELGRRLALIGMIDEVDDVFWLRREEVLGDRGAQLAGAVAQRKAQWRGRRRVTPPQVLPRGTIWDRFDAVMPAASTQAAGNVLKGTGASTGSVTATARVLSGPADFRRMQPGDVLVAGITTPAWTSLFAMASAVVTDVGGPLSHSSIVAREYGIPAVLGTGVATRRITDGSLVHVDGDAGSVTLLDEEPAEPIVNRTSRRRTVLALAGGAGAVAVMSRRRASARAAIAGRLSFGRWK